MIKLHRFACHSVLLALTVLFATSMGLAQVEIINPTSGETVRGLVEVRATKTDPGSGWIAYKIEGPQQPGDFTTAAVEPYRLEWDTLSAAEDGSLRFPDGEYTLTAVGHSPAGQQVGQASVRVTVHNQLPADERPASVELIADYKRGREMIAELTGRARAKLVEHDDFHARIIDMYSGTMEALWRERAMSNSAGISAIVRYYWDKGYTNLQGSIPTNLRRVGDIFTLNVDAKARATTRRKDDRMFELGTLDLQLPDQPVRQGSTWRSPMHVVPLLGADRRRVTGNHRVDGFHWVGGHKCVRIVSEFSESDVQLTVRMGISEAPRPGTGMGPVEMPDMEFFGPPQMAEPPLPDMGMMAEPPHPDMGLEMPGVRPTTPTAVAAPPTTSVDSSYTGTRVSYFAYELSQFVRSEDFISHELTVDSTQFGGAAQRRMPGMHPGHDPMMMDPMMMDPMMDIPPAPDPMMDMPPPPEPGLRRPGADPRMPRQVEVERDFKAEAQVSLVINRRR